jgi:hypothetical protein
MRILLTRWKTRYIEDSGACIFQPVRLSVVRNFILGDNVDSLYYAEVLYIAS